MDEQVVDTGGTSSAVSLATLVDTIESAIEGVTESYRFVERSVDAIVDATGGSVAIVSADGHIVEDVGVDIDVARVDESTFDDTVRTVDVGSSEYVAVPITTGSTRYGTLLVEDDCNLSPAGLQTIGALVGAKWDRIDSLEEDEMTSHRRQFRKLHSVATQLVGARTEEGVFQLAMDAAENILQFDSCSIDVVDDGFLTPVVTSSDLDPDESAFIPSDYGIAGQSFTSGRSIVIDEYRDYPFSPVPNTFQSILTVPIDEVGVFQAAAEEPATFDESDADLAELLMVYVSQAITRIRSESALREKEEKYRTLVEQSHDAVLIIQDERIEFSNERASNLFGFEKTDLQSLSVWELAHPSDADRIRDHGLDVLEGEGEPVTFEARITRADGDIRNCEFNMTGVWFDDDWAIMTTVRDITERKAYQEELERQNSRLEEFASVISHDLRNPLNVAKGRVSLAAETEDLQHLEPASEALDRMQRLISEVLQLARYGQQVEDFAAADLSEVVARAWSSVETESASLTDSTGGVTVEADVQRLLQLFENLFRNAVEHGGEAVSVEVDFEDGAIIVSDDGPGIDPDLQDAIFERGVTHSEGNTGFGLAIVRNVVEAHGWTIEAVPNEGGARFEISGVKTL